MADYKVVVTDYILPDLEIEKEMLAAASAELAPGQCRTASQVIELAHDADGMLNTYYGMSGNTCPIKPRLSIRLLHYAHIPQT